MSATRRSATPSGDATTRTSDTVSETSSRQPKRCGRCQTRKPPSAFYRNGARYDGMDYWCKECLSTFRDRSFTKEGHRRPPQNCSSPDCPHPAITRGLCAGHYQRWIRKQDTSTPLRSKVNALAELTDAALAYQDVEDDKEFTASIDRLQRAAVAYFRWKDRERKKGNRP